MPIDPEDLQILKGNVKREYWGIKGISMDLVGLKRIETSTCPELWYALALAHH